ITPITDPRLRERSYGIYEGQHWRDLMRPVNSQDEEDSAGTTQKRLNLRQPDAPVPEGESLIEFNQRIQSAFESLAQEYAGQRVAVRSEEHTSELQSRFDLVCRLLLEKKKI